MERSIDWGSLFVEYSYSGRTHGAITQIRDYFERKCYFWKNKVETGNHDLTICNFHSRFVYGKFWDGKSSSNPL